MLNPFPLQEPWKSSSGLKEITRGNTCVKTCHCFVVIRVFLSVSFSCVNVALQYFNYRHQSLFWIVGKLLLCYLEAVCSILIDELINKLYFILVNQAVIFCINN